MSFESSKMKVMLRFYNLGFTLSEINFLPPKESSEQAEDFSPNLSTNICKYSVPVLLTVAAHTVSIQQNTGDFNLRAVESGGSWNLFPGNRHWKTIRNAKNKRFRQKFLTRNC